MSAVIDEIVLDPEKEYEIVDGRPEEKEMTGARHGGVGVRLASELWFFARANHLGGIYGPDTAFAIGRNDRLPDIAFVSIDRIPLEGEPDGKWNIAPDLVVEIISPTDLHERVMAKAYEYFDAGVREVWIVSPELGLVSIYRSLTDVTILAEDDVLTSETLLPGFRCAVADIFRSPVKR